MLSGTSKSDSGMKIYPTFIKNQIKSEYESTAFPITPIVSIPEIEQSHQQTFSTMPKDLSDHAGTGNRGYI